MMFIAKIIYVKWFHTMERCFAADFHGVEKRRAARRPPGKPRMGGGMGVGFVGWGEMGGMMEKAGATGGANCKRTRTEG